MAHLRSPKGFTLIEVIVAGIVVAVISSAAAFSVMRLTQSEQISNDYLMATNLLQKSVEEIRKAAHLNYDALSNVNCDFVLGNVCALGEGQLTEFPGLTRQARITQYDGSTEIKHVIVSVNWTDYHGNNRSLDSVLLLARPPEGQPGNLIANISPCDKSWEFYNGVYVDLRRPGESSYKTYRSSYNIFKYKWKALGQNINLDGSYDTGTRLLRPGTYEVRLRAYNGYCRRSTGFTETVTIAPDTDTRHDMCINYVDYCSCEDYYCGGASPCPPCESGGGGGGDPIYRPPDEL